MMFVYKAPALAMIVMCIEPAPRWSLVYGESWHLADVLGTALRPSLTDPYAQKLSFALGRAIRPYPTGTQKFIRR